MSDNLKNLQHFSKQYIDFHEKIFSVHVKCMQHLVAAIPFQKLNRIDITERLDKKKPALNPKQLKIEEKDLDQLFDFVYPVLKQCFYFRNDDIPRLVELNDKRRFSLKDFVITLLDGKKDRFEFYSKRLNIPIQLLEMITELIATPYLELSAEFLTKKISEYHWREPFCPVCGSSPAMAKVDEQNKSKVLWCRRCTTTWNFKDKVCPFCLNDDINKMEFIFVSNRKPYRIDACKKCNSYLKTVDSLILSDDINFSVINIATYYLDLVSKYFGYNSNNYFDFYFARKK